MQGLWGLGLRVLGSLNAEPLPLKPTKVWGCRFVGLRGKVYSVLRGFDSRLSVQKYKV